MLKNLILILISLISLSLYVINFRYKELVDNFQVDYIAGGATLNTMRVCQWLVQKPNVISYLGCIGNNGLIRKELSYVSLGKENYILDEIINFLRPFLRN